jgi:hypothetical protein
MERCKISYRSSRAAKLTIAIGLKHRELNHAIFNFALRESRASDTLERVPMFVEIAEGLTLCSKRRLETAHLPNRANRQNESNRLSLAALGLGHDADIL